MPCNSWKVKVFQLGTVSVTKNITENSPKTPSYYIYGPKYKDDDLVNKTIIQYANELCSFLNNETDEPEWLHSLSLEENYHLSGKDGFKIYSVGPYYEKNPHMMQWAEDKSDESKLKRKEMIDDLLKAIGIQ